MNNEDTYIISIWLVDPVGGEFVNWPENVEDGCLSDARNLKIALMTSANSGPCLVDIGNHLPEVWIAHEQLESAMRELEVALSARDGEFRTSYEKMLKACQFAHSVDTAGVYIG